MKKLSLVLLAMFGIVLIFSTGCKKDEDDSQPENNPPAYGANTVEVPESMSQSSDPGAQQAVAFVNVANGFAGVTGMLAPQGKNLQLKGTMDGPPWIYTWDVNDPTGQYTITLTIYETATEDKWDVVINGTMDGLVCDNFKFLEASQDKNGNYGQLIQYDPQSQDAVVFVLDWEVTADNGETVRFEVTNDIIIEINTNPDGSGNVEVWEYDNGLGEYEKTFTAEWTASGSGTAIVYENGVPVEQFSW